MALTLCLAVQQGNTRTGTQPFTYVRVQEAAPRRIFSLPLLSRLIMIFPTECCVASAFLRGYEWFVSNMHGSADDLCRGAVVCSRVFAHCLEALKLLGYNGGVDRVDARVEHGMLRVYKNNNTHRIDTLQ